METISTTALEDRAKRIFNALGLKDLDIKVNRTDSNGTTSQHVHVDEKGVKSDGSADTAKKSQDTPEKAAKRLTDTIANLVDFCAGKMNTDQLMDRLKGTFEQRMKDQFGIIGDPEKMKKEIDRAASNFFKDPFFKEMADSLKKLGIDISQESINDAAKKLRETWGYDKPEEDKKVNDNQESKPVSKAKAILDEINESAKAQKIKEELEKQAKKDAKKKRIRTIADILDKALTARDFIAICDNTAIQLKVSIPQESEYEELIQAVVETTAYYGFSSYRVPALTDYSVAEVIFVF